jgi:hypothetical protein
MEMKDGRMKNLSQKGGARWGWGTDDLAVKVVFALSVVT